MAQKTITIAGVKFTKEQFASICDIVENEFVMLRDNNCEKREIRRVLTLDDKLHEVYVKCFVE